MIKANDRVQVSQKMLNGADLLLDAQVVSVHGNKAQVVMQGSSVPETVAVANCKPTDQLYGGQTFHKNWMPVIDGIRR